MAMWRCGHINHAVRCISLTACATSGTIQSGSPATLRITPGTVARVVCVRHRHAPSPPNRSRQLPFEEWRLSCVTAESPTPSHDGARQGRPACSAEHHCHIQVFSCLASGISLSRLLPLPVDVFGLRSLILGLISGLCCLITPAAARNQLLGALTRVLHRCPKHRDAITVLGCVLVHPADSR